MAPSTVDSSAPVRVPHADLLAAVKAALSRAGVPEPVRDVEAEVMAEADLHGVPSHGVRMLPGLLRAIIKGTINPAPTVQLARERTAACVLDGDRGPGRYVSVRGMAEAVKRAQRGGVGVCLTTQASHWGRAHAYALRAAQIGVIGICATNAMPSMPLFGSERPLLGNNPLAIGVPYGTEPIVLDMAMSQAAVGKVGTYRAKDGERRADWGLDSAGQPTDDPAAILSGGRLLPMGGHKGAGLALIMEILTAGLALGSFGHEIAALDPSGVDPGCTKLFLALDVEAFTERQRFQSRVADLLDHLRRHAPPDGEILYPGERGWRARAENLAAGVPIHPEIVAELAAADVSLTPL